MNTDKFKLFRKLHGRRPGCSECKHHYRDSDSTWWCDLYGMERVGIIGVSGISGGELEMFEILLKLDKLETRLQIIPGTFVCKDCEFRGKDEKIG